MVTSSTTSNTSKPVLRDVVTYVPHSNPSVSRLATEATEQNYRGFVNLAVIIIVVMNVRLILENLNKYGFILHSPREILPTMDLDIIKCFIVLVLVWLTVWITYFVESRIAPNMIEQQNTLTIIHLAIVSFSLAFPVVATWLLNTSHVSTLFMMCFSNLAIMKEMSFVHVMHNIRKSIRHKRVNDYPKEIKEEVLKYPQFLTVKKFWYFMVAPTLCFQFRYPRENQIRWIWLFKRIVEFVICIAILHLIIEQYLAPAVKNTLPIMFEDNPDYIQFAERLLKLGLPSMYMWLLCFYTFGHLMVNIIAELIGFADRDFYDDWWNARTMGEYWRLWNKPVHMWLKRHVYLPLNSRKVPPMMSMIIVFIVSAAAHEYLASGALHVFSYFSFLGMMSQVPVIIFMEVFKSWFSKSQLGNVFFWISFCFVGQPLGILIYTWQVVSESSN